MTSTMSGSRLELARPARPSVRTAEGTGEAQPHGGREQRCGSRRRARMGGRCFSHGRRDFLVAREETREVLGYPAVVTRIPGAKNWVKGLANVRGRCCRCWTCGSSSAAARRRRGAIRGSSWSIIGRFPAGLMVDEVLGFRRFAESEFNAEAPPTVIRCDSYLAGAFRRGGEVWPVLSLKSLVESQSFLQAAS